MAAAIFTHLFLQLNNVIPGREKQRCSQQPLTACSGNSLQLPSANKSADLLFDACRLFPPAVGKQDGGFKERI